MNRLAAILTVDFGTGPRVSAPTTVLASMNAAARHGILIKGGAYLEKLARVSTVIFDKTGTLTRGVPEVTDVLVHAALSEREAATIAAAAAARQTHPVSQAVIRLATTWGLDVPERESSSYFVGRDRVAGAWPDSAARQPALPRRARDHLAPRRAVAERPRRRRQIAAVPRRRRRARGHARLPRRDPRREPGAHPRLPRPRRRRHRHAHRRRPRRRAARRARARHRSLLRGDAARGQGRDGPAPPPRGAASSPWSATASTTRRLSRTPTSASRSARAQRLRERPRVSCS